MEWFKYLLLAIIIAYAIFVVVKRIKNIKKGNYCSCGCSQCPYENSCHKEKE